MAAAAAKAAQKQVAEKPAVKAAKTAKTAAKTPAGTPAKAPAKAPAKTAAKTAQTRKTAAAAPPAGAAKKAAGARPPAKGRKTAPAASTAAPSQAAAEAPEPQEPAAGTPTPVSSTGLVALLHEKGALAPESALVVLKGSLLALAAAHEGGGAHGDIAPENILITPEGAVQLVDAEPAAPAPEQAEANAEPADVPPGTPYSAPERWAGAPATAASDVYAATAVFHQSLTGAPPYAGATAAELAAQHAEAPVPAEQAPEPVRPLLARGLAKDPAERPQSATEFAAEAEAVAVAAYGEDWEERGRGELAALVVLLAAPSGEAAAEAAQQPQAAAVPVAVAASAAAGAGAPPVPPKHAPHHAPAGGPEAPAPRFSRRAKVLAVVAAAVIIAGAVTVTAVATGNKSDDTAVAGPTPTAVTSLTATTPTSAPADPSPTVSLSASPTINVSPTGTPTTAVTPSRTVSSTPTGTPSTPPTTAPTTPSADPTTTGKPAAGPHVASIAVTGFDCPTGKRRTATATVYVTYDGTEAGTLHLTWWHSATGKPQGAVTLARQTAQFPKGAQSYTFTDRYTFTPDRDHPYVGLSVSSDPAADSGNGTYGVGCR
ncbi:protein kinase [Streptomyces sp. NPDC008139]|uniref:serine/threonine-protein kinase n=1 Tax=Streptomyces sp. NPDC008139 TaxID=3364814 RepID=UPI0036EAF216